MTHFLGRQGPVVCVALGLALAACSPVDTTGNRDPNSGAGSGTPTSPTPAPTPQVPGPPAITGTATLYWVAPTQNIDGSPLTDLAGYRIFHGTNASSLFYTDQTGANSTSFQFASLPSGTHYFAVTAYSSSGLESKLSALGSKIIP